ncbi:MAG: hypothetical protein HOW73_19800 [Polyangiaceae bacterium]|nr:hypothetical protein [Polyangiaceae bacterium]
MNIKLLGILTAGLMLVACGDSGEGGSGGSGGTPEGGGNEGGGTGGTPVEGGGGSTANMGGGGEGGSACVDCAAEHPEGAAMAAGLVIQSCGCADMDSSPCFAECSENPEETVCADMGPDAATPECGDCVQAQADMGINSPCTVAGALSPACGDDAECSAYVTCQQQDDAC